MQAFGAGRITACVSAARVVTHSDGEPRLLAGEAGGLEGLSEAQKQLGEDFAAGGCGSDSAPHSRGNREKRLTGRPSGVENGTVSSCLIVGSRLRSAFASDDLCLKEKAAAAAVEASGCTCQAAGKRGKRGRRTESMKYRRGVGEGEEAVWRGEREV
ncbi:hypothetical protein EYF80_018791 [Liparis tanakae]|uniref:Uncharacterized protein n=1 Tax=Liparis tanakae TaxID=230148 RepID=A0A4Z2I056_9TELE|nr:hypothetical protein EYF80_018791 [Liparis tanakae]